MKALATTLLKSLLLVFIGMSAMAAGSGSQKSEISLKRLATRLEASGGCIVSVGEANCKNTHIRKSVIDAIINMENRTGIWRMYSCSVGVQIREQETLSEVQVDSWLQEFQPCTLCLGVPREVTQKPLVDSDIAGARQSLLDLQGTPAFCQ